jgi:hypothetical protein
MYLAEQLIKEWGPVLDHKDIDEIKDAHRKRVTAIVLENTKQAIAESGAHNKGMLAEAGVPTNVMGTSSSTAGDGAIDIFDPVLISLVRRAMPNLIAYDICGVQPMTGPTGLIFALRARYDAQDGDETFYNEVDTGHTARGGANVASNGTFGAGYTNDTSVGGAANSVGTLPGNTGATANLAGNSTYNFAGALPTQVAEGLGTNTTLIFPEMAFSIEKVTVTARSRALKAEYSMEIAQDLKAIHGLEVENELSNLLSGEILAEINREVVRTINVCAVRGSTTDTTTDGVYDLDTDSNGRWMVEKFKGMMYQLEREANASAKGTRRGKGNMVICSSDVASALQMAGILDYAPALNSNNLQVDDTGYTFAGVLNGRFRVYIDPYVAGGDYFTVGYRGANPMDAGLFYCPYVPLQMVRAVDHDTFQPKIGFKTRYGMVANPFAEGSTAGAGALNQDSNVYYRRTIVSHLM